jgi:hypothetical protein
LSEKSQVDLDERKPLPPPPPPTKTESNKDDLYKKNVKKLSLMDLSDEATQTRSVDPSGGGTKFDLESGRGLILFNEESFQEIASKINNNIFASCLFVNSKQKVSLCRCAETELKTIRF